jgi:hypothetical protein
MKTSEKFKKNIGYRGVFEGVFQGRLRWFGHVEQNDRVIAV